MKSESSRRPRARHECSARAQTCLFGSANDESCTSPASLESICEIRRILSLSDRMTPIFCPPFLSKQQPYASDSPTPRLDKPKSQHPQAHDRPSQASPRPRRHPHRQRPRHQRVNNGTYHPAAPVLAFSSQRSGRGAALPNIPGAAGALLILWSGP